MSYKFLSIYVVSMLLLAAGFNSCKQDKTPSEPKDYHIKNPENILTKYNTGRPDWDMSNRTIGSVKLEVKDSIIMIHHIPQFEAEIDIYFLQMAEKAKNVKSGFIENAEVFYLEHHLLVNSLDSKATYLFSLETDPVPDYLMGIEGVTNVKGFGLGVRKFVVGVETNNVPYCGCVPADYPMGNCNSAEMNPVKCVTATEAGSCKVVCSGQTFACCDMKGVIAK